MTSQTTTKCPFCGRVLKPLIVEFCGKEFRFGTEQCTCVAATNARERAEQEEADKAERELRDSLHEAYLRAGVKPRFMGELPADLMPKADAVFKAVSNGKGAYLHGNVGTGKSSVSSWVAMRMIDCGKRVKVTDSMGIVAAFYATFSGQDTEDSVLARLRGYDLLVIDELGKESTQERSLGYVFRVINDRYEQMKPVLVTSQFSRSKLIGRLARNGDVETAQAIASRLKQMCEAFAFEGEDRRLS